MSITSSTSEAAEPDRSPAGANPADGPLANLPADTPFRRLEDKYYPGDIGFDPAGLKPSDPKEFAVRASVPVFSL